VAAAGGSSSANVLLIFRASTAALAANPKNNKMPLFEPRVETGPNKKESQKGSFLELMVYAYEFRLVQMCDCIHTTVIS
jgi:hypothetical protein